MVGRQSGWLDCIEAGKDYKQKAKLSGLQFPLLW
jgi:hypothetical protein